MRTLILYIGMLLLPALAMAQGGKGQASGCAPMVDGKICYVDEVDMDGMSQKKIYEGISRWAKKNYAKDIFLSNVVTNKKKKTVFVSSKVELLLNDTDKTIVGYKLSILCEEGKYKATLTDITYQYDPNGEKKYRNIPAEEVIANEGKGNQIAHIKNPRLFCDATYFFAEQLFGDVFNSLDEDAEE